MIFNKLALILCCFAVLSMFSCTTPTVPESDVLIGQDDAYSNLILYRDRNIPPLNWKESLSSEDINPFAFDWYSIRKSDGWYASLPLDEDKNHSNMQYLRTEAKKIYDREYSVNTKYWEIMCNENDPPLNWKDIVPAWIETPNRIDWADYRYRHGWKINLE